MSQRVAGFTILAFLLSGSGALEAAPAGTQAGAPRKVVRKAQSGRELVARRWWEQTPAIARVSLKGGRNRAALPLKDPAALSAALDGLLAQGITALEIFAPAEGGRSFGGLDTINRYRIDPEAGSMDDFRRLVETAHKKRMPIIAFDNLGYCSVEAGDFLKACDDVRAGRESRETRFFLWSDRAGAPPPGPGRRDTFFFVRPTHLPGAAPGTFYDSTKAEFWQFSERAQRYYWTKWGGADRAGNRVRLPQYNWGSQEFQEEAEKIVRFWMDTGIDGMVIDAVNWYIGHTWEKGRRRMTDVIASYGNTYMQPEGAGGFREDPVAWITEGGWNSVQDYGLGIWWEKGTNVIQNAIESGDPRPIEHALRDYHDRVVASGGVLYYQPTRLKEPEKSRLAFVTLACLGDMIQVAYGPDQPLDPEAVWILKTKAAHPALHQLSSRRKLPTLADDKVYAMLRTAADRSERVLAVLNFQPAALSAQVDMSGVATAGLVDLKTGKPCALANPLTVELPAYGFRLFEVKPARRAM